jgi:hypothetical protein
VKKELGPKTGEVSIELLYSGYSWTELSWAVVKWCWYLLFENFVK